MDQNLINTAQNILNQYSYFTQEQSSNYQAISDINEAFLKQDNSYWQKFLDFNSFEHQPSLKEAVRQYVNSDFDPLIAQELNDELTNINKALPQLEKNLLSVNTTSPLAQFKLTMLDKRLFSDNTQEIHDIEELVSTYQEKKLPLNSFVAKFNFHRKKGALGQFNTDTLHIHVNGEKLSKAIFAHEYFHALDFSLLNELSQQLSIVPRDLFFSHLDDKQNNLHNKERNILDKINHLVHTPIHTTVNPVYLNDLKLHFKYYFDYDIKPNQTQFGAFEMIEMMDTLIPSKNIPASKDVLINGEVKHFSRFSEKDDLMKILEKSLTEVPKQSLYSLFSQVRNLVREHDMDYFSLSCEKLARIYQTQFVPQDTTLTQEGYQTHRKVIPLGAEREKLVSELNSIVENDFKPYLTGEITNKLSTMPKSAFSFDRDKIKLHRPMTILTPSSHVSSPKLTMNSQK